MTESIDKAKQMLRKDEGFRSRPYKDTTDHLTIGYGRNLDVNGIRRAEAEFMLDMDVQDIAAELQSRLPVFGKLDPVRQAVLIDMAYNLGTDGLLKFKRMIAALKSGNYVLASIEMSNSLWAEQVGARANRLAELMKGSK